MFIDHVMDASEFHEVASSETLNGDPADDIRSLVAVDFDSDDDLDLLFATNDGVSWYENTSGWDALTGPYVLLSENFNVTFPQLQAIDIDGDEDIDLTIQLEGSINIYQNVGDTFSVLRSTNFEFGFESYPLFRDTDSDGDADLSWGGVYFENVLGDFQRRLTLGFV